MPRKVRDSSLETRSARIRLKATPKPHFRLIEPGLHLGYRKLASGPGNWVVRRYAGGGKYTVNNLRTADDHLSIADDFSEADGLSILDFGQAQERAKDYRPAGTADGPYTVANAMDDYLRYLEGDGRPATAARDARYRDQAFIRPALGDIEVAKLTADRLRRWRDDLAKMGPRRRTKKKQAQRHGNVDSELAGV